MGQRIAVLEPFSGISGDMMLGALVAVGLEPDFLSRPACQARPRRHRSDDRPGHSCRHRVRESGLHDSAAAARQAPQTHPGNHSKDRCSGVGQGARGRSVRGADDGGGRDPRHDRGTGSSPRGRRRRRDPRCHRIGMGPRATRRGAGVLRADLRGRRNRARRTRGDAGAGTSHAQAARGHCHSAGTGRIGRAGDANGSRARASPVRGPASN